MVALEAAHHWIQADDNQLEWHRYNESTRLALLFSGRVLVTLILATSGKFRTRVGRTTW